MAFLKNAWYVAAFDHELTHNTLLGRTIMGEPICLSRTVSGSVAALHDTCPHRFAPLSHGRKVGDLIECRYHGLNFDSTGTCVKNPHGPIASNCSIRSYPTVERDELIWVWMGDSSGARSNHIPDLSVISTALSTAKNRGYTHARCNYLLLLDNLMDLSHVDHLHAGLTNKGSTARKLEVISAGAAITARYWMPGVTAPQTVAPYLQGDPTVVDQLTEMTWHPPSLCRNFSSVAVPGQPIEQGASIQSAHLITPESETTCHYFWCQSRNYAIHDEAANQRRQALLEHAFTEEDKPVLEAIQTRMSSPDLLREHPMLFQSDGALVRVRRALARLIDSEEAGVSKPAV